MLTDKPSSKRIIQKAENVSKARQRPWTILYLFGSLLFVLTFLFVGLMIILRVVHLFAYIFIDKRTGLCSQRHQSPLNFAVRGADYRLSGLAALLAVTFSKPEFMPPELRTDSHHVTKENYGTMKWGMATKPVHPPGAIGPINGKIRSRTFGE